jgi:hypothetical protein
MTNLGQLFNRKDVHPVVVDIALLQVFGPQWVSWDSDSTAMAVEREYGAPASRDVQRKIDGLAVMHANPAYWEDWRAFEAVSWALSGKQVDLIQMTPLTPLPLMYGHRTSKWIDPNAVFSDEVQAYIVAVFLQDQFSLMPPELGSLQDRLQVTRPDLVERADAVKSALLAGGQGAGLDGDSEDPVRVEVTKHRVLSSVLSAVCSKEALLAQAQRYGLDGLMAAAIKGIN